MKIAKTKPINNHGVDGLSYREKSKRSEKKTSFITGNISRTGVLHSISKSEHLKTPIRDTGEKREVPPANQSEDDSKSRTPSDGGQFCSICDVKVGGNLSNFRLHLGGAVHKELIIQKQLGMETDKSKFYCRVCSGQSKHYNAFRRHLGVHPSPSVTLEGSDTNTCGAEIQESLELSSETKLKSEDTEGIAEKRKASPLARISSYSEGEQSGELVQGEDHEGDEAKLKWMEGDEEVNHENGDGEVDDNNEEDDEEGDNEVESDVDYNDEKNDGKSMEVEDDKEIKELKNESVSMFRGNLDRVLSIQIDGKETRERKDVSDESDEEIELDDTELIELDDEEIEEFQNQNKTIGGYTEDEVLDIDGDYQKQSDEDFSLDDEIEDEYEKMRQCFECHKYFPDETMLADHLRTHVRTHVKTHVGESRAVVEEERNTFRSSVIPDLILDTTR